MGKFKTNELVEVYTQSGIFEGYILGISQGARAIQFRDDTDEDEYYIRLTHITTIRRLFDRDDPVTRKEEKEFVETELKIIVEGEEEDIEWEEDPDEEDDFDEEYDEEEYDEDVQNELEAYLDVLS